MTDTPATSAQAPLRQTVYSIQIMRGFAAAAVAIYHTHLILLKPQYGGLDVFGTVSSYGWLGVNFFFVLSGFIIMFAHAGDIGRPAEVRRYAWRRFVRVYPIYWILTALYVTAALVGIGYPDFGWDLSNMIASLTLIMIDSAPLPPLQVAWTLFYEVMFYIAFLTVILNRKLGILVFAAWIVGILIYAVGLGRSAMGPFHMWNIHFLFGIGAFFLFRDAPRAWALPVILLGIASFALLMGMGVIAPRMVEAQHDAVALLGIAISFALVLGGITMLERRRSWKAPASLLLLGDASYSIYLVHSPVLSVFAGLQNRLFPALLPGWLLFVVAAAVSLATGIVVHLLLEKRVLNALWMRIGRVDRGTTAVAAGAP